MSGLDYMSYVLQGRGYGQYGYNNTSGSNSSNVVNQNLVYPKKPGESGGQNMGLTFLSDKSWVNNLMAGLNIVNVAGLNLLNWINVGSRISNGTAPINSNPGEKSNNQHVHYNTSGTGNQDNNISNQTLVAFMSQMTSLFKPLTEQAKQSQEQYKTLLASVTEMREMNTKMMKRLEKLEKKA